MARRAVRGRASSIASSTPGHILGSSTFALWYQDSPVEKKIVFSGDIGNKGNPIIADPELMTTADYVVMESTYGNRLHKSTKESIDELVEAIKVTFKRGGNVIMPVFAVGRTQDLLYILNETGAREAPAALRRLYRQSSGGRGNEGIFVAPAVLR